MEKKNNAQKRQNPKIQLISPLMKYFNVLPLLSNSSNFIYLVFLNTLNLISYSLLTTPLLIYSPLNRRAPFNWCIITSVRKGTNRIVINPVGGFFVREFFVYNKPFNHLLIIVYRPIIYIYANQCIIIPKICEEYYVLISIVKQFLFGVHTFSYSSSNQDKSISSLLLLHIS